MPIDQHHLHTCVRILPAHCSALRASFLALQSLLQSLPIESFLGCSTELCTIGLDEPSPRLHCKCVDARGWLVALRLIPELILESSFLGPRPISPGSLWIKWEVWLLTKPAVAASITVHYSGRNCERLVVSGVDWRFVGSVSSRARCQFQVAYLTKLRAADFEHSAIFNI